MSEQRSTRVELQPACILHRRPYRETSLLLEVFSRDHGRVPLVARGARRMRRGAGVELQPFRLLLLGWGMRGEVGTLHTVEARTQGAGSPLAGDALPSGFYVNELLMRLLHRFDPHPVLFDVYQLTLEALGQPVTREAALRRFETRLLQETGYGLALTHDVESGEPLRAEARYVYNVERGPRAHRAEQDANANLVVSGATLLDLGKERLHGAVALSEAKRLMRRVIDHHLGGRPLQSRALFRRRGSA